MSREQLRELARETVEISRAGRYTVDGQVILFDAARPTELWTAQDLDRLVRETVRPAETFLAAIRDRQRHISSLSSHRLPAAAEARNWRKNQSATSRKPKSHIRRKN